MSAQATEQLLYWRQRAKSRWDSLDDKSHKTTKFFYKSVKCRLVRHEIRGINDGNGTYLIEDDSISRLFDRISLISSRPRSAPAY